MWLMGPGYSICGWRHPDSRHSVENTSFPPSDHHRSQPDGYRGVVEQGRLLGSQFSSRDDSEHALRSYSVRSKLKSILSELHWMGRPVECRSTVGPTLQYIGRPGRIFLTVPEQHKGSYAGWHIGNHDRTRRTVLHRYLINQSQRLSHF